MSERKIARTVAEAQIGDLLWYRADKWRPCPVVALPVRKVGRAYVYIGSSEYESTWYRIRKDHPTDNNFIAWGYQERERDAWLNLAHTMAKQIQSCRSVETLRSIASLLDIEPPEDFSATLIAKEDAHG